MSFRTAVLCVLSISTLFFEGCVIVGVDYKTPEFKMPDAWTVSLTDDLEQSNSSLKQWWEGFNDPILDELIERTRDANPDLRIASQRIAETRAMRGVAGSRLVPFTGTTGEYARTRASESLFVAPPGNPSDFYNAGFDAGWEIDVFGSIHRNIESADASIEASIEAYRDLLVTLFAETALNYVEYRTIEERIRLVEANITAQTESLELTQSRLDAGLAPRIDVTEATTNLESSRALIPLLRTQLALARNRTAALTGGYPASLDELLHQPTLIPVPDKDFTAALPAELIRARPDVRQAERELAAQTARIGVAAADLYPRFTLFGNFGFQSVRTADLFNSPSQFYSFGPAFNWQIFSAGRIRNNIRVEEARTEQALVNYENTVLLAVEDVESSLAAVAYEWDRLAPLKRAVESSKETVSLVKDNYRSGLVDFQRVLDAERIKFNAEDEAAISQGQIARNYIMLYKALGGGTEVEVIPLHGSRTRTGLFGRK